MTKQELKELKIAIKIPQKLDEHLTYLETLSKRSKEFIIKEALIQYLENAEDVSKYYERERAKGDKTYTTEELLENLNLKGEYQEWEKTKKDLIG